MENTTSDRSQNVRNEFKQLSIEQKIGTLFELEMMTVAQGFEKLGECSISLANRIFEACTPPASRETSTGDANQKSQ